MKVNKLLIGITGVAGSGKDTVANLLSIKQYAFAQPMKEACRIMFNWDDRHLHGDLKEVVDPLYGKSPRYVFQTLGTEWGRDLINNNLWLIAAQNEIDKSEKLVITDVRMENEAKLIRDNDGIIIHVLRPSQDSVAIDHRSENGISLGMVDYTIVNDGSLTQLYAKVNALMSII